MNFIPIGRTGRPHGTRGELKLFVEEFYEEDLLAARVLLIGEPPLPYFIAALRGGGTLIVELEDFKSRESVLPLSNQPLLLRTEDVAALAPPEENPYQQYLGYTIAATDYPPLGPITEIVDLPEHYLAVVNHEGREVYIPLHPDLIVSAAAAEKRLEMQLPLGLLNLGE